MADTSNLGLKRPPQDEVYDIDKFHNPDMGTLDSVIGSKNSISGTVYQQLTSLYNGKSNIGHTHPINDVVGLPDSLSTISSELASLGNRVEGLESGDGGGGDGGGGNPGGGGDYVTRPVQESDIASNAVTAAKIASNAVTAAKIASNAVTTAKIANGNVTWDKLSQDVKDRIESSSSSGLYKIVIGPFTYTPSNNVGAVIKDSISLPTGSNHCKIVVESIMLEKSTGTSSVDRVCVSASYGFRTTHTVGPIPDLVYTYTGELYIASMITGVSEIKTGDSVIIYLRKDEG